MSFSADIKNELLNASYKSNCCKNALLLGLTFDATCEATGSLCMSFCDKPVAELTTRLLTGRFHRDVTVSTRCFLGRTVYDLKTMNEAAVKFVSNYSSAEDYVSLFTCEQCSRAFLTGLFLSLGHVADPAKEIHLYFSFRSVSRVSFAAAILEKYSIAPKSIKRKNCTELYYKSSDDVAALLTYLEVGKPLFDILNTQIEKEIRNQENRATNCDARNIGRVVAACNRNTRIILKLQNSPAWVSLPDTLRNTASLRLQYPDLSLLELALLHTPPVSKSCVSHRLKKIDELAKSLNEKQ